MRIEDEDQRRLDHNARLLLLLASLTKLLLSPIQPSSPLLPGVQPPIAAPSRSLLADFLATLIALPGSFLPAPYLHINGTVPP